MPLDALNLWDAPADMRSDAQWLPDPRQPRTWVVDPIWVWRVPFAPLSMPETVTAIGNLIEAGRPTFFITANTHYVMLTQQNPDLQAINVESSPHRRRRGPVGVGLTLDGVAATGASRRRRSGLRAECGGGQAGIPFVLRGGDRGRRGGGRRCASSTPDSRSSVRSVHLCTN